MADGGLIDVFKAIWRQGFRPGSRSAYGFAICCSAVAVVIRYGLGFIDSDLVPFATFFPAVVLVTILGGTAAGILALAVCGIAGWWLFVLPEFSFFPITRPDMLNMLLYVGNGGIIIWAAEGFRRARREAGYGQETASELDAIVSYSGDAIVSFALDGTIRTWNIGAERLFGYSAEEAIGRPLSILVPPDKNDEPATYFPRSSSGELLQFETVRVGKNNRRIDVSVSTGPIRSASGRIIGVSSIFHDIRDRKQREDHIHLVMRELSHRANNLLAVIHAIARRTAKQTTTIEEFERRFSARLQALAHSHEILVRGDWHGAQLGELIKSQLSPFADVSHRIQSEGPEIMLSPRAVEQIGIALHELATNAIKHGALSTADGSVRVHWKFERDEDDKDEQLRISWQESGGPRVATPTHEGFGFLVLRRIVPAALNGRAEFEFLPNGINWTLTVPKLNAIGLSREHSLLEFLTPPATDDGQTLRR
jgi:PAS domain S-box-containing protein